MSETELARELFEQANRARRENRLDDSRRHLAEAVALLRQAGEPQDLAAALKGLGQIERDLGHRNAALLLYEEAA